LWILPLALGGTALGCTSQGGTAPATEVAAERGLPYRVAVLPVELRQEPVGTIAPDLAPVASRLAAGLAPGPFADAVTATDADAARAAGADLVLACELVTVDAVAPVEASSAASAGNVPPAESARGTLVARFFDAGLAELEGVAAESRVGLFATLEVPVEEGDWAAVAGELAGAVRARSQLFLDPGLAPLRLDPEDLAFAPLPSGGSALTGSVRFAPVSRTRRLRGVSAVLPDGSTRQAELSTGEPGGLEAAFRLELPPLPPGSRISLSIEAGSRVRYRLSYTLEAP
jgi:hypothetical protein